MKRLKSFLILASVILLSPSFSAFADNTADRLDTMEKGIEVNTEALSSLVDVSGYYDFTYVDNTKEGERNNGVFRQHHLSMFLGRQIKRFRFFSEIEFEYGPKIDIEAEKIKSGTTDKVEILVETAWLEYNHSDLINIRTGKHLTPYGWWNKNHYPILVLTTSRPESSRRIFPEITTGIQLYGSAFHGGLGVDYNIYYINDINNGATNKDDVGANKGLGGRIGMHLPIFDVFEIGVSSLIGDSTTKSKNRYIGFDELIKIDAFELLGEFAYNDSQEIGSTSGTRISKRLRQKGYYIQPSLNITHILPVISNIGQIIFVYRYDYTDTDNTTSASNDKTINTVGLNYKPIDNIAIKLEHNWYHAERATADREYKEIQASITMFF